MSRSIASASWNMEKEEPAPAPTLEELLRPEDEEALSLADFEDEQ